MGVETKEIYERLGEVTVGLAENNARVAVLVEQNDKLFKLLRFAIGAMFVAMMVFALALIFAKTGKEGVEASTSPLRAISSHDGGQDLRKWLAQAEASE